MCERKIRRSEGKAKGKLKEKEVSLLKCQIRPYSVCPRFQGENGWLDMPAHVTSS